MSIPRKARITALASYLPERILTNQELEATVDTNDEWIVSRTGIKERRIAAANEGSSSMGLSAAKKLILEKGIDPLTIDLVLVATMSPDYLSPSNAALIQHGIGASHAAAVDLQAACTGFVYGVSMAKAYIESGMYKRVLLIATEKMSSFVNYEDRNTCILFGDGAAAALIEPSGKGLIIDSICLGADGESPEIAWVPAGGSLKPPSHETIENKEHYFRMQGKELFKHAVRRMGAAAKECLSKSSLQELDINYVVPHQANARIIDALEKAFSIDTSKVYRTIHKYGNTSASSMPIALDELLREKKLVEGDVILLCAFGAGLTWGASILKVSDA